jgi:hypothetical protein
MHWSSPSGKDELAAMPDRVRKLDDKMREVITGQFMGIEDDTTSYMKLNAPWKDQTGNARAGLFTTTALGLRRDHWELILSHSVRYGIYLEICNSGKYAIIMPTIRYIGPILLERLESSLAKIGALK